MNLGRAQDDMDLGLHPIWFNPSPEEFVPAIGATEIDAEVCRHGRPSVPLHPEYSDLLCPGWYDPEKDTVFAVSLFIADDWRGFNYVDAPRTPLTL